MATKIAIAINITFFICLYLSSNIGVFDGVGTYLCQIIFQLIIYDFPEI